MDIQFWEAWRDPNKMHPRGPYKNKWQNGKKLEMERMLNAARVNQLVTYKDTIQRLSTDFLTEN